MKKNRMKIVQCLMVVALFISFSGFFSEASACTIGVVSGKGTPDGRPLLWKNRDTTSGRKNEVKFFTDSPWMDGYIAVVTSDDYSYHEETLKVWSGVNDAGFAINNSLVSLGSPYNDSSNNGVIMKQALMTCVTVDDFQDLLEGWYDGKVTGNFGVIDAHGGAAMFEVRARAGYQAEFIRTDAATQDYCFVVMANANTYGSSPDPGTTRKQQAIELFTDAFLNNKLTHEFILRIVARDLLDTPHQVEPDDQFPTQLFISRYRTRSCTVVRGVWKNEDPHFSTFWTILGEPAFGVAVPLFSYAHSIPFEIEAPYNEMAPMNAIIENRELRSYTDNMYDTTIRPYPLWYPENGSPPIQKYAFKIEDYTFKQTESQLDFWRAIKRIKITSDYRVFEDEITTNIYKCYYSEEFFQW